MMHAQLIELLEAAGTAGVKQTDLQRGLKEATGAPVDLTTMAEALNRMLKEGMISIGKLADGTPVYRRQSSQDATRLTGLSSEERLVLQLIETTGNIGMWTRDIRLRSNLQQVHIPKILKTLEARKLIKAVKSVASKNKKMYMLYDLEPPHEPFYTDDQELDLVFISVLQEHLHTFIRKQPRPASLDDCWKYIRNSRIANVELRYEDVQALLEALVFDAKLEKVEVAARGMSGCGASASASAAAAPTAGAKGKAAASVGGALTSWPRECKAIAYRALHTSGALNALALVPCSACSLVNSCQEAHQISPESCVYFTRWLDGVNNW